MAEITINVADSVQSKLQYIEERTGAKIDLVSKIMDFISLFENENGDIVLTDVDLLPSEYEYKAYTSECSVKGVIPIARDEWRDNHKRKVVLIDDTITMMGQRYASIWDRDRDTIIKAPLDNIKM